MADQAQIPVLVVGAGPTGLMLACTLRQYGIGVRLIDRLPEPATVSKALAIWSGSLEALAGLDVVPDLLAAGVRLDALKIGHGQRELAAIAVGQGIDSPYPFPLLLPQSRTEAVLGARAEALGAPVERGTELVSFTQSQAGVTATLRGPDGTLEEVRAAYLVGADGARSTVRHTLGTVFEGTTEPSVYLLGDVAIAGGGLDHRCIHLWWGRGGTVALFPYGAEVWRIFAVRTGEGDAAPTLEELQAKIDRHGPGGLRLHDPIWLSSFRINERLAASYRAGRVFLAGDAAHIHSPAGGQGMNTGIQDAANLGWKLAYVLQGRGDHALLLDSYEAERRPVARAVVSAAAARLHAAFATNRALVALRDLAVGAIGKLPWLQEQFMVDLSETEIVYREGPLVALGDPPRRSARTLVGSRARDVMLAGQSGEAGASLWPHLTEPRHTLLVFGDEPAALPALTEPYGAALATLRLGPREDPEGAVRARYRLSAPGWVLIRPDQVVAARGGAGELGLLERYLDRVVRPAIP